MQEKTDKERLVREAEEKEKKKLVEEIKIEANDVEQAKEIIEFEQIQNL